MGLGLAYYSDGIPHACYYFEYPLTGGLFADGTTCNPESLELTGLSWPESNHVQSKFMVVKLSEDKYYKIKWISDNTDHTVTFQYELCSGKGPSIARLTVPSCATTAAGSLVCPVTDVPIDLRATRWCFRNLRRVIFSNSPRRCWKGVAKGEKHACQALETLFLIAWILCMGTETAAQ